MGWLGDDEVFFNAKVPCYIGDLEELINDLKERQQDENTDIDSDWIEEAINTAEKLKEMLR